MTNRINEQKRENGVLISIKAFQDPSKQKNLLVWALAWTFCGVAIGSQLFVDDQKELRSMLLVFLAFWLYFEYKVIKAYRWRQKGEERFFITEDEFHYGRIIGERGIMRPFEKSVVNPVREIEAEKNEFIKVFSNSYWVIGGEGLAFTAAGKVIPFGLRLTEKEKKKLMQLINKNLS
tara:strand:- start:1631 stop:2161 length:531 start_codon:yes stop_codon:yes gene_type:complete